MSESKLRIGIVGGGTAMRERHMPVLRDHDDVELVAVCNRRVESSRQFADDFDIQRIAYHWEELARIDELDIVWIATPPHLHTPIACEALRQGKHVFCPSPPAHTLDHARQLLAAVRDHPHLVVGLASPPVGRAGDAAMRKLLHEERFVGAPRQIALTSVAGHLLDPEYPAQWRLLSESAGANVLTLAIYLDILLRWIGPVRHVLALTRLWTRERLHLDTAQSVPVDVPESANILLEFEGGAVGQLTINGVSAHGPSDHVSIHGTEGTLVYDFSIDPAAERLEGARRDEEAMREIPIDEPAQARESAEVAFLRAVRASDANAFRAQLQTATEVLTVIDAIARSASRGQRISISDPI